MRSINIFGVNVSDTSVDEIFHIMETAISTEKRAIITHVHVMGLNIAYQQPWFRDFLNNADLVYCDGMGVKLGAQILGEGQIQRITMADWIWQFCEFCKSKGYSCFFLGNSPGASQKSAELVSERFPGIQIVGTYHGFFDRAAEHPENLEVLEMIKRTNPDILFVGFGMPMQEEWLSNHWHQLTTPVAITCGGIFDVLTGNNPRGPAWLHQHYLEWLARFMRYPGKYWRRYLVGNSLFLWRIIKQRYQLSQHPL